MKTEKNHIIPHAFLTGERANRHQRPSDFIAQRAKHKDCEARETHVQKANTILGTRCH